MSFRKEIILYRFLSSFPEKKQKRCSASRRSPVQYKTVEIMSFRKEIILDGFFLLFQKGSKRSTVQYKADEIRSLGKELSLGIGFFLLFQKRSKSVAPLRGDYLSNTKNVVCH
jgi:hypothetical protein